ncbi:hypothetical protein [Prochlorothrix hollandica]|uniref:Uncharacterized protein n=1 Tax=Prochlorothrix hollandica PCC 9006 = CALU 1027 TaxID=317619 RepID=A0A0M2Q1W0_PROHO|nr:hypothetical protein [Prochlorothrix hollandica]KKJ01283.1 hypothetical protein PROH_02660 [Prochlorothrix hollandica PCC 9006 = CALU 1027]
MILWIRRLPKTSLLLLWLTYGVFGWYWSAAVVEPGEGGWWSLALWPSLVLGSLILAAVMTGPLRILRSLALQWLASDMRSFGTTIVAAFLGVFLVGQMTLVTNLLILFSAMGLARLDLQTHRFDEWTAFWVLGSVALLGLTLGGFSHWSWAQVLAQGPILRIPWI